MDPAATKTPYAPYSPALTAFINEWQTITRERTVYKNGVERQTASIQRLEAENAELRRMLDEVKKSNTLYAGLGTFIAQTTLSGGASQILVLSQDVQSNAFMLPAHYVPIGTLVYHNDNPHKVGIVIKWAPEADYVITLDLFDPAGPRQVRYNIKKNLKHWYIRYK